MIRVRSPNHTLLTAISDTITVSECYTEQRGMTDIFPRLKNGHNLTLGALLHGGLIVTPSGNLQEMLYIWTC